MPDERVVPGSPWRPEGRSERGADPGAERASEGDAATDRSGTDKGTDKKDGKDKKDRAQGSVEGEAQGSTTVEGAGDDPLSVARRERDEYLDMVRRVQADFENYKKRMIRQQTDLLERAGEALVVKLLPALDAFDLTRAHLENEADVTPEVKALLQASDMVNDVLTKEGVERIAEAGVPFDPKVHDAVEHAPTPDAVAGSGAEDTAAATGPVVAEVLRSGYRWKGRVIRPAMVRVRG